MECSYPCCALVHYFCTFLWILLGSQQKLIVNGFTALMVCNCCYFQFIKVFI